MIWGLLNRLMVGYLGVLLACGARVILRDCFVDSGGHMLTGNVMNGGGR